MLDSITNFFKKPGTHPQQEAKNRIADIQKKDTQQRLADLREALESVDKSKFPQVNAYIQRLGGLEKLDSSQFQITKDLQDPAKKESATITKEIIATADLLRRKRSVAEFEKETRAERSGTGTTTASPNISAATQAASNPSSDALTRLRDNPALYAALVSTVVPNTPDGGKLQNDVAGFINRHRHANTTLEQLQANILSAAERNTPIGLKAQEVVKRAWSNEQNKIVTPEIIAPAQSSDPLNLPPHHPVAKTLKEYDIKANSPIYRALKDAGVEHADLATVRNSLPTLKAPHEQQTIKDTLKIIDAAIKVQKKEGSAQVAAAPVAKAAAPASAAQPTPVVPAPSQPEKRLADAWPKDSFLAKALKQYPMVPQYENKVVARINKFGGPKETLEKLESTATAYAKSNLFGEEMDVARDAVKLVQAAIGIKKQEASKSSTTTSTAPTKPAPYDYAADEQLQAAAGAKRQAFFAQADAAAAQQINRTLAEAGRIAQDLNLQANQAREAEVKAAQLRAAEEQKTLQARAKEVDRANAKATENAARNGAIENEKGSRNTVHASADKAIQARAAKAKQAQEEAAKLAEKPKAETKAEVKEPAVAAASAPAMATPQAWGKLSVQWPKDSLLAKAMAEQALPAINESDKQALMRLIDEAPGDANTQQGLKAKMKSLREMSVDNKTPHHDKRTAREARLIVARAYNLSREKEAHQVMAANDALPVKSTQSASSTPIPSPTTGEIIYTLEDGEALTQAAQAQTPRMLALRNAVREVIGKNAKPRAVLNTLAFGLAKENGIANVDVVVEREVRDISLEAAKEAAKTLKDCGYIDAKGDMSPAYVPREVQKLLAKCAGK